MKQANLRLLAFLGVTPKSPEQSVLRLLIELGAQIVGAKEGSLLVADPKANELEFVMTVGDEHSEQALIGQRVPLGEGITGLAALTEEVQIGAPKFKDIEQTERVDGQSGQPACVLAAPMLAAGELVGVITAVKFDAGNPFGDTDALLFSRIAAVAGVLIEQSRRLQSIAALENQQAASEDDTHELRMARSIGNIAEMAPDKLAAAAQLLANVEVLCAK